MEEVFSRDSLFEAYLEMKEESGQAPGPDGITYSDLSTVEAGRICGKLAETIQKGKYVAQGVREVSIPKSSGRGFRTLKIASIFDRVVAKAMLEGVEPLWEKIFLGNSYGFRPRRSPLEMLAAMERTMYDDGLWVVALDDISNAFDNVRHGDVVSAHRKLLDRYRQTAPPAKKPVQQEQDPLLDMVSAVLRLNTDDRRIGIDQGNPYSPATLNAVLHFAHDVPLGESQNPSWYRYADDLVYLCRDVSQGRQALKRSSSLLRSAGLELKGDKGVTDLRKKPTAILGFVLGKRGDRLEYDLHEESWTDLRRALVQAHDHPDPQGAASSAVLHGWIDSKGPAFGKAETYVSKVLRIAAECGFRECGSPGTLQRWWSESWRRWCGIRRGTTGDSSPDD